MRKIILIFFSLCVVTMLQAQVYKTITGIAAGGVSAALTSDEQNNVTNLTITGIIDARDFKTIRDKMVKLVVLDISGVSIAAYTGKEGTCNANITYPINEVPCQAFAKGNGYYKPTSITLPTSIVSIGDAAFDYCQGLSNVTIPEGVTSIGKYAFHCCEGLTGTLVIPSSVSSIGDCAFGFCNLTSVTILSTKLLLGKYVFSGDFGFDGERNEALSVIKVFTSPDNLIASPASFKSEDENIICNTTLINSGTLYVPKGKKEAFQLAAGWNSIANILEYDSQPTTNSTLSISVKVNISSAANSSICLNVNSNTSWNASSNASWLTVNPLSESDVTALSFNAIANTTGISRTATVTISATGAVSQTVIVVQEAEVSNGISDVSASSLEFYPNPVAEKLYLNNLSGKANITIYNLSGEIVIDINTDSNAIDVGRLTSGFYTICINQNGQKRISKFVKQ